MAVHRRNVIKLASALVVALSLALSAPLLPAQSGKTEVLWLGQATFKITTPGGKVIVIDPFVTGNPKTPADLKDLAKGGKVQPLGPQITITQVRAEHSSELTVTDPATKKSTTHVGGEPAGFIIQVENGFKIYHMGDTGLFGDMKLIADYYKPDLVLIPIGGHFVMDPVDAAYATKEWLKPKFAIPIHYGTFPVLKGTPQEYMAALGQTTTKVFAINPGDRLEF